MGKHTAQSRRNKPANRWGCKPHEDVCVEHDEALCCKHGCSKAKAHQCQETATKRQRAGTAGQAVMNDIG